MLRVLDRDLEFAGIDKQDTGGRTVEALPPPQAKAARPESYDDGPFLAMALTLLPTMTMEFLMGAGRQG